MSKPLALMAPNRADHRFLLNLVDTFYKKKGFQATPELFDRVNAVFYKMGGSWERVFKGSGTDVDLLKRILKVAAKCKIMKKAPSFR